MIVTVMSKTIKQDKKGNNYPVFEFSDGKKYNVFDNTMAMALEANMGKNVDLALKKNGDFTNIASVNPADQTKIVDEPTVQSEAEFKGMSKDINGKLINTCIMTLPGILNPKLLEKMNLNNVLDVLYDWGKSKQ